MYPPVCFSCGRPIGHLWISYYEQLQRSKIENGIGKDLDYDSDAKFQILANLQIADECCRRMFISEGSGGALFL